MLQPDLFYPKWIRTGLRHQTPDQIGQEFFFYARRREHTRVFFSDFSCWYARPHQVQARKRGVDILFSKSIHRLVQKSNNQVFRCLILVHLNGEKTDLLFLLLNHLLVSLPHDNGTLPD